MHVAVVGGSDAGIEAARRCRELAPRDRGDCPRGHRNEAAARQQAAHVWGAVNAETVGSRPAESGSALSPRGSGEH